jgi:hypothetical protein
MMRATMAAHPSTQPSKRNRNGSFDEPFLFTKPYHGLGDFGQGRGANEHHSESYEGYGERGAQWQRRDWAKSAIPKRSDGGTKDFVPAGAERIMEL